MSRYIDLPFTCEYAKSGRASCKLCRNSIAQDELRLGLMVQSPHFDGKIPHWYHYKCFWRKAKVTSEGDIHGFDALRWEDQERIRVDIAAKTGTSGAVSGKKRKAHAADAGDNEEGKPGASAKKAATATDNLEVQKLKEQSNMLWKIRDNLNKFVTKKDMAELLEFNGQSVPSGESKIMDRLCDVMLFGALLPCSICPDGGQLTYSTTANAYVCTGNMSGFSKCTFETKTPLRKSFTVPEDFTENEYLASFKFKAGLERIFPINRPLPTVETKETLEAKLPLHGLKFVINKTDGDKKGIQDKLKELGASVVSAMVPDVVALITTEADVKKMTKKVRDAESSETYVVSETFLNDVGAESNVADAIRKHSIATWGRDAEQRMTEARTKSSGKSKVSGFTKSVPASAKLVVKGTSAVDPESHLDDVAHVLEANGCVYNVVMNLADVQSGTNQFYKLQLLQHDTKNKFWVFRQWGRVGTNIGGSKVEDFGPDRASALANFKALFLDKTGNSWEDRKNFVKRPNKFLPLDIDYGHDDEGIMKSSVVAGSKSKLAKAVQQLIQMIFDIEQLKTTMASFEIDLKKMPLGKLSKAHIKNAYKVLTELQELVKNSASEALFVDASNRFYTLIPHDFGLQRPPLLNNEQIIKTKTDMLDNLLEIEIAYSLLKGEDTGDEDPIDVHYKKLNAQIDVLDREDEVFKLIEEYVHKTHAKTHTQYSLKVRNVFAVARQGEATRFKPFKKLHNRMLLWHGSRVTNFAGILAQGLRIAPPEAPSTGYMFGKGIYFADMVSKSANYCFTTASNPVGLLLLCDVALGNMYECTQATYVEKLPKGKHSTKGIGKTAPNPQEYQKIEGDVTVPVGDGVNAFTGSTSLLYNEYIVYDVAQVNVKYLVELDFKYK